ncbi:MAG: hypothetical protein OEZ58_21305 [Gammaproteobacteria bacterium]|nr:hypothetical protein [Gammaproteobacteria bacterium]MDH5731531.1 hypothetical protein [Gammaproteobacteria bacterium]
MNTNRPSLDIDDSKRSLLRKSAYVVPAVMTLSVLPSHAAIGSTLSSTTGSDPNAIFESLSDEEKRTLLQLLLNYFK